MNELEKISVLIPVYNREEFIIRAIDSIQNQTYKNWELVIWDDGSTDCTRGVAIGRAMNDERISVIGSGKNHGVGYARNKLLDFCATKYACWQDSDDTAYPTRLEEQVKAMTDETMCFCGWDYFGKNKKGTTQGFATLMFPVNKTIRFKEDMQWGGEDWDWIKKMKRYYFVEHEINKTLYSIDFHNNGRIGQLKRKFVKEWGGKYTPEEIAGLTYSQVVEKYEKEFGKI